MNQDQRATSDVAGGKAHGFDRALWFCRYPGTQTFAAFLLALLATAALSVDQSAASYSAIHDIDPYATGALYICYEVLLSFAGHTDAVLLLAFAVLLVFPLRYVFFGRRDSLRPSVVVPAITYAACMVVGRSYDLYDDASLIVGGISQGIVSTVSFAGWSVLAHAAIYLLYEALDWLSVRQRGFSESRYGVLWRTLHAVLDRHPFVVPLAVLVAAWLPTLLGSLPGLFMGDTGAQIRQWFNLPNGTSDYLRLVNPAVLLNGHHPVAHTALLGSFVQLGLTLFGSENAGLLMYTLMQFSIAAATLAYVLSALRELGVSLAPRAVALGFFVFMPLFSNYAVLATKDTLFGCAFVVLVVQMGKLLARVFARWDWALLMAASLGCAFLRNGGAVFVLAACVLAAFWAAIDARRGDAHARVRLAGVLAVLACTLVLYGGFTKVLMPALDITPGSRREMLSIPFQQTARFVQKHDSLHAGLPMGEGTDDGLVSSAERETIDRVLRYGTLATRYDPDKSDAVKNAFNEDATSEDMRAYFKVWASMFLRDPACYLSAFVNNYYGYFYPSERDVFTYSRASSSEVMARPSNSDYFDFHHDESSLSKACDQAVTLYRVAIQRIPLLSLLLSSSTYVWLLIVLAVYVMRDRRFRELSLLVPLAGIVAMCLIGPCNGSTYMRYLYPMIMALPFAFLTCAAHPRPLSRAR